MMIVGKNYERMKSFVQVWIPATSSAYFALATIWGLPAADKVVGTLAVVATFLGVTLKISSNNYYNSDLPYDGDLVVTDTEDGSAVRLDLTTLPEDFRDKESITFKVNHETVNPL
jgi:hypothetical protein